MTKPNLLLISLLTGAFISSGFSSPALAKTLPESIQAAWEHHPSMAAAEADHGYATREVLEQKSAYFPQISLNASGGRQFADNATTRGFTTTRGSGYSNLWDATVALRQSLYDGGGRSSRVDSAEFRSQAAQSDIINVQDLLAGAVSSAYIEILRVYRGMSMVATHRGLMNDYITRLDSAVQNGAADKSEYNQALDLILSLDNITHQYESDLRAAEASYSELIGEIPSGEFSTPIVDAAFIPASADAAMEIARSGHAALQSAKLDAQSYEHEIDTAKAEYYPAVDGELSYLKSEKKDLIGGEAEDARAFVRMNWNFETGGATYHRINKSKFLHAQSLAQIAEIDAQLERDLKIAYAEYEGALKQLKTQTQRLEISRKIFDTSEEQFEGARLSILQLMQAENQKFLTHLDQVAAQHRVLNAQYRILSAMGKMRDIGSSL